MFISLLILLFALFEKAPGGGIFSISITYLFYFYFLILIEISLLVCKVTPNLYTGLSSSAKLLQHFTYNEIKCVWAEHIMWNTHNMIDANMRGT